MSRDLSLLRRNVERTLRIEVTGVKDTSQQKEAGPEPLALDEPPGRTQQIPLPEIVVDGQLEGIVQMTHRGEVYLPVGG
jgi:hypothetical protein